MAVGTTALLATAAVAGGVSAYKQAQSGRTQAKSLIGQGEFNAQVYEQQAGMIQEQKKLQDYQFNRQAAKARGSQISRTAGAGLLLSGSPLAMMIDSETQMLLDQAVGNYNLDVQRNYALSAAKASRDQAYQNAKLARSTGYTNAFTTLMSLGTSAAMLKAGKV